MAKVSSVNLTPATGSVAIFQLMEWLRDSMGFTITISGDGLAAFDNTGTTVVTSGTSGANGMGNTDAHFTAQDPGGVYEWCFQRGTTNVSWEVVTSALDGFSGGNATTRPTATDEQVITNTTLFTTDNSYRWHLVGNTTPIGVTVPVYPWVAYSVASGTPSTLICHEPLDPGSYPELVGTRAAPVSGEPDPCIYVALYGGTSSQSFTFGANSWAWQNDTTSPARGWYCMNGVNGETEAFVNFHGSSFWAQNANDDIAFPDQGPSEGVGVDPRDGSDPMVKFLINRDIKQFGNSTGPKGMSSTLRIHGIARVYPDTLDVGGERFVYAKDLLLPFENGTAPLI